MSPVPFGWLSGLALAVTILIGLALLAAPAPAQRTSDCRYTHAPADSLTLLKLERSMRCLINQRRERMGMRTLVARRSLGRSSGRHTRKMLAENCYEHECPNEADLTGRLRDAGYLPAPLPSYGEAINIQKTVADTFTTWMHSPPHREILLDPRYRDIGVGAGHGVPVPGYSDRGIVTFTADLGRRR